MEKIRMDHQHKIEEIRARYGHTLSSHAFVSLYLWQKEMDLSICIEDDFFAVRCGLCGENAWFFPCGSRERTYQFIHEHMDDRSFSLYYLRSCDAKWLEEAFPHRWTCHRNEDCDEYLCDIVEFDRLEGGKFSEIRRKIRKIDQEHAITVRMLDQDTIKDAKRVISAWYHVPHHMGQNGLTDDRVSEMALCEREALDISGIVLYVDDEPMSVFGGFALSADTVDVLIGKCVPNAPKGLAYYALRSYLHLCAAQGYTYCNHEEDLGIEGIRAMKNSLCPIEKTPIREAVQR